MVWSGFVNILRSRRRQLILWILLIVVGVPSVMYLSWWWLLTALASQGDAPTAADMHFPESSVVVSTDTKCASGGCRSIFTLRPGKASSPETLSSKLEATFGGQIPGTLANPRTIDFTTKPTGTYLVVNARYRGDASRSSLSVS